MAVNFDTSATISRTSGLTTVLSSGTYGMLRAANPSFAMYGANAAAQGTVVTYASTDFDVTSGCNPSTGRFTAPLAGMYFFRYHQLVNFSTTGEFRAYFRVNGAGITPDSILYKTTASTYSSMINETLVSLAVNDYVEVYINVAPFGMDATAPWSFFQGYKI